MKIISVFDPYALPKGSVSARCHVLREKERAAFMDFCVSSLPDCYITEATLRERIKATKTSATEVFSNKIPDPGSVMSGDFGEIVTLFFLGSECAQKVELIKKWRYKQDRKKTAPHSDVVILYREFSDRASAKDFVITAEAKQKATASAAYAPIEKAIAGVALDQTGRLARTLTWLHEKALDHGTQEETALVKRFTHDLSITFSKQYKAVAIVDKEFIDDELTRKPSPDINGSFEVVVIGIKDLKAFYESVFGRAVKEIK